MIPQSLLANDTVAPSLIASFQALRRRLDRLGDQRVGGYSWSFHSGKANATMMPDADVGVWLHMATILPEQTAFQSSGFLALWEVQVILKDAGKDKYGFDEAKGLLIFGGVIRALTETFDDVSLDESVDDVEFVGAEHQIGRIGDRDLAEWNIRFRVTHPLLQHDRT